MKNFFDTVAVFIANALRLNPTSWSNAKKQAETMRAAHEAFKPSKIMVDGKEEDVAAPQSPFGYLGDTLLLATGFVLAVWFISKVVSAFFVMLPYLIAVAAAALLLSFFGKKASAPEPKAS